MISVLITVSEKLRYQIKSLIYEAQEGFYKTFLFSPVPPPGFPVPTFFTGTLMAACQRKESERQAERENAWHLSLTADWWREKTRDMERNALFIHTFPLPVSWQQEANDGAGWSSGVVLFCCPVRPGEGQEGGRAVSLTGTLPLAPRQDSFSF